MGRKAPSPEKKRGVSEDQEGCGQTSQQTSPDWFEGGENAEENVWPYHFMGGTTLPREVLGASLSRPESCGW